MRKKSKKKRENKANLLVVLGVAFIIILGIFALDKAAITGFVVLTEEKTFDDNMNLVIKESQNVTWNLRNPGVLKTIKATGAITRNGTVKVFIQKDDKKLLIFDSTKQLFDVNVQVLSDYKKIFLGEELLIQIILFNLRGFGVADVNVKYSIKDPIGNIIATEEEVVTVETQAKFVRKLVIPSDLKTGNYVTFVEVTTPDGLIGTSSDSFEVTSKYVEEYPIQLKYITLGLAVIVALIVLFVFSMRSFKKLKKKQKVVELKSKIPQEKVQKLEKELKALESAYKAKFISKASYLKGKARIEKELQKLRR